MTEKRGFSVPFHHSYLLMVWILILLVIGYTIFVDIGPSWIDSQNWLLLILCLTTGILALLINHFIRRKNIQFEYPPREYSFDGLKEQLARGDIIQEEYDRMNKELMNKTIDYILIGQ